jgi:hypothetical protein
MRSEAALSGQGLDEIRTELAGQLRKRSAEIEDVVFTRVRALSEAAEGEDPEYRAGLRATVAEVVDYALVSIELGEDWAGPIPVAAAAQARMAARAGIRLDTVLRRYAAGDRLIGEFIMDEAEHLPTEIVREILRGQGPHVDRLMADVANEYMQEWELVRRSPAQRVAERVQRLLVSDAPLDAASLDYEFDAWHLGLIVAGPRAAVAARTLAAGLDRRALVVPRGNDSAWAWLGGRDKLGEGEVEHYHASGVLGEISLAFGEPRAGLDGWRLTHHEAQAARLVAMRSGQPLVRASGAVLLAAVLRDEALAKSLKQTYLVPLNDYGEFGAVLRETLRAYFAAGFNAATAAAALEIDRHTVQRRLRKAEEALGLLLQACHAELAVALRLEELDAESMGQDGGSNESRRTTLA